MYVPITHTSCLHTCNQLYTLNRTINYNNIYLVEANSIEKLWFSILAYYYLSYLISRDKTDSKHTYYYKYNVANIVKLFIFLFHIHEAL